MAPFRGKEASTHLCNLEVGYGGRCLGSKLFKGAAPGFEPRTSCMRVRIRSHYATEAAQNVELFV